MSYKFTPKTEDEVQAEQLCPEGLLPFTVLESADVVSKSEKNNGKPMIKLKLAVHSDDGFDYHVYDYVADWFMAFKFRHFFYGVGLGAEYEAGNVDASKNAYAGRTGWCDVGTQKNKQTGRLQNSIRDYQAGEKKAEAKPDVKAPADNTDDVPF